MTGTTLPRIGGPFDLIDHHGNRVTDAGYRGRFVLLFFGFTHCRIVCPRALTKLSEAVAVADPAGVRFRALYVTIDPDRDTPERMRDFLSAWPRFTGLTGGPAEVEQVKASFRVFSADRRDENGNASLSHSAFVHLLDPTGKHIDHWLENLPVPDMISRLEGHGRSAVSTSVVAPSTI